MSILSKCALLNLGQDSRCISPQRKYFQQAILINKSDIENYIISHSSTHLPIEYNVRFSLKPEKKGYLFSGAERGNSYFGNFDKSTSDFGFPQYIHRIQMLITGVTEETKYLLHTLDKGEYVSALQFKDGTIEIYGIEYGLTTADYTYDVQTNGGGTVIQLQSTEAAPEDTLPLIYKSMTKGSEIADFDSLFIYKDIKTEFSDDFTNEYK